jgi:hypothetical protein
MARRKLPEEEVMVTSGIKLPKEIIAELENLGNAWGCKPSTAGRELLLLGLDVLRAAQKSRIFIKFIQRESVEIEDKEVAEKLFKGKPVIRRVDKN